MFSNDSDSTTGMPRLLVIAAVALLAVRIGVHVHPPRPRPDLIAWRDLASGEAEAARSGRAVLYEISAAWCAPCGQLDRQVFHDPESARMIERRYIPVRIVDRQTEDGANPPAVQEWLDRHHVRAFPTLIVESHGRGAERLEGYAGRGRTKVFLESILPPKP
jgi:thiol:disulfide interchange protein